MTTQQKNKLLISSIILVTVLVVLEGVFAIPVVENFFVNLLNTDNLVLFYIILWIIMFLQTNILNIPAYIVLEFSLISGIVILSPIYLIIVLSAYVIGCVLSYWLGRWFGSKAVKWVAGSEEDFRSWCDILNKKGKWVYALTVVFPLFPDDLLCLIAGSVKMNFWFYLAVNTVGRGLGLVCMCVFLTYVQFIGGGFPIMLCVWCVCLIVLVIYYIIFRRKNEENKMC